MTDTTLSEAQIEKAAEAAYTEWARHIAVALAWDDLKHSEKECWRYIVTTAVPYLQAQSEPVAVQPEMVCLDERDKRWMKAINDEGQRISWQGFGAEDTFANSVYARLSAPKPVEGRVTIRLNPNRSADVMLDGKFYKHQDNDVDATRYSTGLIAELRESEAK